MLYLKENPIGLDAVINVAQVALSGLTYPGLNIYPRCYPKETDRGRTLEFYTGKREYELLNVAEGNKFFFDAENDLVQVGNGYFTTTISCYAVLNLEQCKPDTLHRADAEVWSDVLNALGSVPFFGTAERIITKFNRVFERYDYQQENDMQPYHCFRVDIPVLEFRLDFETCDLI